MRPTDTTGGALGRVTRRSFLHRVAGCGAAAALAGAARLLGQTPVPFGKARIDADGAMALGRPGTSETGRTRVVRAGSPRVVPPGDIDMGRLTVALHEGLAALTDLKRPADAWHRFLRPDDVVLVKFNRSAADLLATTAPLATLVIESLIHSGWAPERLIALEVRDDQVSVLRDTRRADLRWQGEEVPFGKSGADSFIAALDEATAIVNVPFLKTHHLATMTSCMKNLSHGLIRRPARFHANGCNPAIAEIVASRPIRSKLRLNIVNGLRIIIDHGNDATTDDIATAGTLLLSADPVACDATGYEMLNEFRAIRGRKPLLRGASLPPYLMTAAELGLGETDSEKIEVVRVET